MTNLIKIVIGSWGSYNECNDRALGSKWLDLGDYNDWEEIEEELKQEGFELDGIDAELFIQDIECPFDIGNCDNTNPETLFNTIKESGILEDSYEFTKACAFIEVFGFSDFQNEVENYGARWDDSFTFYQDMTGAEVMEELTEQTTNIPENLKYYIDYEAMARDEILNGFMHETSYGVLF